MAIESPKTTLYLIRHGEPLEGNEGRFYGQLDVPLSERGKRQSQATAERLAAVPLDAIYSSDLQRAGYLADLLSDRLDLPVRRLEVFRERNFGIFQGMVEEEMRERSNEEYAAWNSNRIFHAVEGGENFEQLQQRVMPALQILIEAFSGARVALVSHAGPIRVILAHLLGMPLEKVFHLVIDFGGINVLEYPAGQHPRLKLLNG